MWGVIGQEPQEVMIQAVNKERAARLLRPVVSRKDLECASRSWAKSQWRLRICGHVHPQTGAHFWDRVRTCEGSIRGGVELIACNVPNIEAAVGQWVTDPQNAQYFFSPYVTTIGIGHAGWTEIYDGWYVLLLE